ncbi:hypothetical protein R2R35_14720 [Anaerocolumna sp. AGMB13020]|uniref:hypothetical protein n=1 Tax=Anaerocolumna sp. AGMB13020 TaxID=3081750 RepID=UPI0029556799|nr:hypothetical protein [Anaerocolumna sp. AGMB13020]WOO35051.1 hypothetical protein R2R35_14720 [Anaerocolumna sp. AGMB13020]
MYILSTEYGQAIERIVKSTELRVYERMFKQFTDRCIVSVLHRLHLLHLFDYIYVFRDGKIVEEGTIEQLKKAILMKSGINICK